MRNKDFGNFVRVLREQKKNYWQKWTQDYLAAKANLTEKQVARIEQGEVGNLEPFLEPLAIALDLNELQKAELYARAGYVYQQRYRQNNLPYVLQLLGQIDLPASARTPVWDFIAFNEYHRVLWGYTLEMVQLLNNEEIGPNLLRVWFDEKFRKHQTVVRSDDELLRLLTLFRTVSFPYITSPRYQNIVQYMMDNFLAFRKIWDEVDKTNSNKDHEAIRPYQPVNKIAHPDYGEMTFMSLQLPQRYVGEGIDISIYIPLSDEQSQQTFERIRENVKSNPQNNYVHIFKEYPL